jgi:hypothetical protein
MPCQQTDSNGKKVPSTSWNNGDDDVMLRILLEEKEAGNSSDNGFKDTAWQKAADALEERRSVGGVKKKELCKTCYQGVSSPTIVLLFCLL